MKTFHSVNPKTGATLGVYPIREADEVACAVERMRQNVALRSLAPPHSAELRTRLGTLRDSIAGDAEALAQTVSAEIGKPLQDALGADLLALVTALDWLAANALRLLAPRAIPGERQACLQAAPCGVVGVIGTWNYPLLLDGTMIAWALAAGNAVVWKPSELATASASALYPHFQRAGLPVEMITGDGSTGSALCATDIDKLAFTGGVATGRKILAQLAPRGIPSVMELSGNDALIVCEDADIAATARAAVWARVCNAGQSCVAPQRIYVVGAAYQPFVHACQQILEGLRIEVDYGPLRTAGLRERVHALVEDAQARGAHVMAGGRCLSAPATEGSEATSFYYAPTLLAHVDDAMPIQQEDFFGPVLCVRAVADEEEALAAANAHPMGLGASVWTSDLARGKYLAGRLRAGIVTVNLETLMTGARPGLPFGGRGASGFGRQRGAAGLDEFVSWKTVCWQGAAHAQRHIFPYRAATLPILRALIALKSAHGLRAKLQTGRQLVDAARKWNRK